MTTQWETEFPNMTEMPALPESFADTSWHNDIAPSYMSESLRLQVYINYPNLEDREESFMEKRFGIFRTKADSSIDAETFWFETDHWSDILRVIAAARICERWVARLGGGFHPDTRGADYSPRMTPEQIRQYDHEMELLFSLPGDPYGHGIHAMRAAGLIEA